MAPQSSRKRQRNRPLFNVKEIALYGLPFWIGALLAGWYLSGWIGLRSAAVGLALLGLYVGSEIGFAALASRYQRKSPGKVVGIAVAGFWIRLIGLWILTYLVSQSMNLNLPIALAIVAFGFTIVLALSVKNWLRQ